MASSITVVNRPEKARYEVLFDGELAGFMTYELRGSRVALMHTDVDERFAGHGLGSRLVGEALDDARAQGRSVLPYCPFVRRFIAEHTEYVDLVPESVRGTFGLAEAADT
jgi:uncharacterized protein